MDGRRKIDMDIPNTYRTYRTYWVYFHDFHKSIPCFRGKPFLALFFCWGLQGSGCGSASVTWMARSRDAVRVGTSDSDLILQLEDRLHLIAFSASFDWQRCHWMLPSAMSWIAVLLGFSCHFCFQITQMQGGCTPQQRQQHVSRDMWAEALQEYLWDSTGREASAHGKMREFCHCSQQTRLPFDISCRPSRAWPLLLPSSTCRMFATRRGAQVQSILKSTSGNLIQCSRSLTLNESGATGASCSASTGAPLVWRSSCDGWGSIKVHNLCWEKRLWLRWHTWEYQK